MEESLVLGPNEAALVGSFRVTKGCSHIVCHVLDCLYHMFQWESWDAKPPQADVSHSMYHSVKASFGIIGDDCHSLALESGIITKEGVIECNVLGSEVFAASSILSAQTTCCLCILHGFPANLLEVEIAVSLYQLDIPQLVSPQVPRRLYQHSVHTHFMARQGGACHVEDIPFGGIQWS